MADLSVCKECNGVDGHHNEGCRWATPLRANLIQRLRAYADFLKNPPPPPPGVMSIGPLFEAGANATAQSIGATLDLILKGEDGKLMQWTEGNEALRKALGLKP